MQNSTFNAIISAFFVLELRNALLAVALAAIMDYRIILCAAPLSLVFDSNTIMFAITGLSH